jgi:hypothetical protein
MDINYWAVLSCALLSLVLGFVWYGPLFGRKWIEINELSSDDLAKREAMQKEAGPLYVVQFVLSLLQIYILAHFVKGWSDVSGVESALWIWLGFVMPNGGRACHVECQADESEVGHVLDFQWISTHQFCQFWVYFEHLAVILICIHHIFGGLDDCLMAGQYLIFCLVL